MSRIFEAFNKPYCQVTAVDGIIMFAIIIGVIFIAYLAYMFFEFLQEGE